MYADGFTSLQDLSSASHSALQQYGVPIGQTARLQDAAKDADAGVVVFMVKSKYDDYRLSMKKGAGRISLELLDRALRMHKPPLKAKLINNGPINTRGDGTLAFPFNDGVGYELEAETLPGFEPFLAYPQFFSATRLLSSWIHT
ncbi:hypothetical protein WJX82_009351 [Trebouxia sp. C0006]